MEILRFLLTSLFVILIGFALLLPSWYAIPWILVYYVLAHINSLYIIGSFHFFVLTCLLFLLRSVMRSVPGSL